MKIEDAFKILKLQHGTHTHAAKALSIQPRTYRRYRNVGSVPPVVAAYIIQAATKFVAEQEGEPCADESPAPGVGEAA